MTKTYDAIVIGTGQAGSYTRDSWQFGAGNGERRRWRVSPTNTRNLRPEFAGGRWRVAQKLICKSGAVSLGWRRKVNRMAGNPSDRPELLVGARRISV